MLFKIYMKEQRPRITKIPMERIDGWESCPDRCVDWPWSPTAGDGVWAPGATLGQCAAQRAGGLPTPARELPVQMAGARTGRGHPCGNNDPNTSHVSRMSTQERKSALLEENREDPSVLKSGKGFVNKI